VATKAAWACRRIQELNFAYRRFVQLRRFIAQDCPSNVQAGAYKELSDPAAGEIPLDSPKYCIT
jgi:hypothetical protein